MLDEKLNVPDATEFECENCGEELEPNGECYDCFHRELNEHDCPCGEPY